MFFRVPPRTWAGVHSCSQNKKKRRFSETDCPTRKTLRKSTVLTTTTSAALQGPPPTPRACQLEAAPWRLPPGGYRLEAVTWSLPLGGWLRLPRVCHLDPANTSLPGRLAPRACHREPTTGRLAQPLRLHLEPAREAATSRRLRPGSCHRHAVTGRLLPVPGRVPSVVASRWQPVGRTPSEKARE